RGKALLSGISLQAKSLQPARAMASAGERPSPGESHTPDRLDCSRSRGRHFLLLPHRRFSRCIARCLVFACCLKPRQAKRHTVAEDPFLLSIVRRLSPHVSRKPSTFGSSEDPANAYT